MCVGPVRTLPTATRSCGLVLDDNSLDDHFANLAAEATEVFEASPGELTDNDKLPVDRRLRLRRWRWGGVFHGQGDQRLLPAGCRFFTKKVIPKTANGPYNKELFAGFSGLGASRSMWSTVTKGSRATRRGRRSALKV